MNDKKKVVQFVDELFLHCVYNQLRLIDESVSKNTSELISLAAKMEGSQRVLARIAQIEKNLLSDQSALDSLIENLITEQQLQQAANIWNTLQAALLLIRTVNPVLELDSETGL